MQPVDPALTTKAVALAASVLMVQAGLAKRMLAWRPRKRRVQRPGRGRRWWP
jgi:hypothetical protein